MLKQILSPLLILLATTAMAGGVDDKKATAPEGGDDDKKVHDTWVDTRLINGHSTRLLGAHKLDVRITHRFGDIGGDAGGFETMYGTDNAADIRIGFEYGISDRLNVGLARNKGSFLSQIVDSYIKFAAMEQSTDGKPVSIVLVGTSATTLMTASEDPTAASSFKETAHRFAYTSQILISRKFGDRAALQLAPTYIHRNYVAFGDENSFLSVGVGGHVKLTKVMGLMAEYYHNLPSEDRIVNNVEFQNPLSFGLTFDTGGHVFSLVFSNARGIHESQFIPYTTSQYSEGQFRYGFTISRQFTL